jgi:ABC-type polysaccharide/polyol phosphate export permease
MRKASVFWRQTKVMTVANLKCRYRKTLAGFLWVVLNPMITFSVQALVFGKFLKIDVEHYLLFLVSGLVPWIFIAQTLEMSAPVFLASGPLLKSFSASPLVYLSAQVFDNLINFAAGFLLALFPIWFLSGTLGWHLLLLPFAMLTLALGVFATAWLLATFQVFFRDTRFLISFAAQVGFFLTPIFYPRSFVPAGLQWLTAINPIYRLISPFQVLIHDYSRPAFSAAIGGAALTAALLWALALAVWWRRRNLVYFYV